MEMIISNNITIHQPSQEIMCFCKNNLIVTNPEYILRQRMGKWLGSTPQKLYLYEEKDDSVIIPYGCKNKLSAFGIEKKWGAYPALEDFKVEYNSDINLYDYQEQTVNKMIKAVNGVIIMPCGSGKTQTALECVARLGLKTLWLTHTQDLLSQSLDRAKMCFDCPPDMFGVITAGKVKISKGITFATVQTMCKIDLAKYRNEWAVVIVDECQHCCGSPTRLSQFYRVVSNLYAPYKFGLTATPDRSDGLEKSMFALLGDQIAEVTKDQVSGMTCKVKVKKVFTGYLVDNIESVLNGDGTINYSKLTADLIENNVRLNTIMEVVNSECKKHTLVLANRLQYLKDLQSAYKGKSVMVASCGTSKKEKEKRKNALQMLNNGDIDCIFATYQLAAEGLDCPNLRYVVFATPEKNSRTVTQAIGRVARKADGKDHGTVIDFVDSFGLYNGWAKVRDIIYKKLGCKVEII